MRQPLSCESSPTQAASRAWVFGMLSLFRLNLVRPPDEHRTSKPVANATWSMPLRVTFTAAALLKGFLVWLRMCVNLSGSFARKPWIASEPFCLLHW